MSVNDSVVPVIAAGFTFLNTLILFIQEARAAAKFNLNRTIRVQLFHHLINGGGSAEFASSRNLDLQTVVKDSELFYKRLEIRRSDLKPK